MTDVSGPGATLQWTVRLDEPGLAATGWQGDSVTGLEKPERVSPQASEPENRTNMLPDPASHELCDPGPVTSSHRVEDVGACEDSLCAGCERCAW